MGRVISLWTNSIIKLSLKPWAERQLGIAMGLSLVVGSGIGGWGLVRLATILHPAIGLVVEVILLASCFAGKSLRRAAEAVLHPLQAGEIAAARQTLGLYVGRDTDHLDQPEILRAVLETVSENATDGVMGPLFYALVGAFIVPIGSVPLALAYKAASTLDSMVGYRRPPYRYLGWFSARLEDILTWLPCRLTVLTIALLSRHPIHVFRLCRRDAPADPSPNAGWSECAYAAALGVQLGGTNRYRGQVTIKPKLAEARYPITPQTIDLALRLTRWAVLVWLGIGRLARGGLSMWTARVQ
jgi:adenosylcobinamide-phosphate synthase